MPDPRLDVLAKLAKSAEIVPTRLTFVDIAGLVKGASKGEGLGNQFLGNIREVDAIAHVVRCFEDADVTHVDEHDRSGRRHRDDRDRADARRSRQPGEARRRAGEEDPRAATRKPKETLDLVNRALALLREGKPARFVERKPEEEKLFHSLGLLDLDAGALRLQRRRRRRPRPATTIRAQVEERAEEEGAAAVVISAKIESEIAVLPREEREIFSPTSA